MVHHEPLEEFNNPGPEPSQTTVTKFIEAESEAEFAVKFTIPSALFRNHGMRVTVRIESVDMIRKVYHGSSYRYLGVTTSLAESGAYVNGEDLSWKFKFSELDICMCHTDLEKIHPLTQDKRVYCYN